MTSDLVGRDRTDLLELLEGWNKSLRRRFAQPLLTYEEAEDLPLEALRRAVVSTGYRLEEVLRADLR